MPKPSTRTKNRKRHNLRLPGGGLETHYKQEKPDVRQCSRCGRELPGVPRSVPSKVRKLAPSQRRVERIYGGQLCHGCLRDLLKEAARGI